LVRLKEWKRAGSASHQNMRLHISDSGGMLDLRTLPLFVGPPW
jgi:hypothetical protein